MKLILANNQTEQFTDFYNRLQAQSSEPFEYSGYATLLFGFGSRAGQVVQVTNLTTGKKLDEYDGVYINGYLKTYELAASMAIACDSLGVGYVNKELAEPPSLSKLSMYARLAAAGVNLPRTIGGSKTALSKALSEPDGFDFPAVLKRADADQGVDNFKVETPEEALKLLTGHADLSLWLLQELLPNNGFYLLSFYDQQPAFCIFRSLQERPDGDRQKAHMYKPKGGANASLVELADVPEAVKKECQKAVLAMNRQIASVDCIYQPDAGKAFILEVNYNPQLVTIETFKDIRIKAFLENIKHIGN